MNEETMFALEIDAVRNRTHVCWIGRVTAAGAVASLVQVEKMLLDMKPGFTVLTDLTKLESMEIECSTTIAKIMDLCRAKGVGTVVRVIPDPTKDIGLNILSIIHYRRGVRVITCETREEAEKVLG